MDLFDRRPDFYRSRMTRCAACGYEDALDDDWFERWGCGDEACPGCGVDCTEVEATRIVADPTDPALRGDAVPGLSWWHSSTHDGWPSAEYEPAAALDEPTRQRMGGDAVVLPWSAHQRGKALHVGTYEAAVHNMLRRIKNQGDRDKPFYLYRVCLRPDVVVSADCGGEFVNSVGDVALDAACPPGIDATRYVNQHEDPGGISLALGRSAIRSVQRLPIPFHARTRPPWYESALARLTRASREPLTISEPDNALTRLRRTSLTPPTTSECKEAQEAILSKVTAHLPLRIGYLVRNALSVDDTIEPAQWCDLLANMVQLIDEPEVIVRAARRLPASPVA